MGKACVIILEKHISGIKWANNDTFGCESWYKKCRYNAFRHVKRIQAKFHPCVYKMRQGFLRNIKGIWVNSI